MSAAPRPPAVADGAIVLAGGRASRLGGVQKADVEVGGFALLDIALEAAAGSQHIIVVGPEELRRERGRSTPVRYVREHPSFGGPVAGIAAGLAALDDRIDTTSRTRVAGDDRDGPGSAPEWVLVLACDLPFAPRAVRLLEEALIASDISSTGPHPAAAAAPAIDGVCLVDADGREQWLAGIYRSASLRRRLDALAGVVHGASVRSLVDGLDLRHVFDDGAALDVDTWQDVEEARRIAKELP